MLEILGNISDSLTFIYDFFFSGIYNFFIWTLTAIMSFIMVVLYTITASMMQVTWDVVKFVFEQLDIGSYIDDAWQTTDSTMMGYLSFFRIPEAFNNIFSAFVTRFAFKFTIPWY